MTTPIQLTLWPSTTVNHLASRGTGRAWRELADSCGSMFAAYVISCQGIAFGRTSPEHCPPARKARRGRISDACSEPWMTSGMVSHGEFWTRSSSESPNAAAVCSLSEVLETDAPPKYCLSPTACAGILRRAETRGKPLPPELREALEEVALSRSDADAQGGGKGALIQEDVSATLSCSNVQTLFQPAYGSSAGQSAKAGSIAFQEEQSPTLRAGASGTNQVPSVLQPTYCIQGTVANGKRMGQNGSGYCADGSAYTLDTMDAHAVAFAANQRGEVRLQGGDGDVFGALPCSWSAKQVQAVVVQSTVVIDRAAYNQGVNAQYPPHIELVDVMDTLVARGPHAVAYQAVDC